MIKKRSARGTNIMRPHHRYRRKKAVMKSEPIDKHLWKRSRLGKTPEPLVAVTGDKPLVGLGVMNPLSDKNIMEVQEGSTLETTVQAIAFEKLTTMSSIETPSTETETLLTLNTTINTASTTPLQTISSSTSIETISSSTSIETIPRTVTTSISQTAVVDPTTTIQRTLPTHIIHTSHLPKSMTETLLFPTTTRLWIWEDVMDEGDASMEDVFVPIDRPDDNPPHIRPAPFFPTEQSVTFTLTSTPLFTFSTSTPTHSSSRQNARLENTPRIDTTTTTFTPTVASSFTSTSTLIRDTFTPFATPIQQADRLGSHVPAVFDSWTPAIIGSVVGVVMISLLTLFCWMRKRRDKLASRQQRSPSIASSVSSDKPLLRGSVSLETAITDIEPVIRRGSMTSSTSSRRRSSIIDLVPPVPVQSFQDTRVITASHLPPIQTLNLSHHSNEPPHLYRPSLPDKNAMTPSLETYPETSRREHAANFEDVPAVIQVDVTMQSNQQESLQDPPLSPTTPFMDMDPTFRHTVFTEFEF